MELRAVLAIIRKDIRVIRRYPMNLANVVVLPLVQFLLPGILLANTFMVHGRSVGLAKTAGTDDAPGFLFLGAALTAVVFAAFWGIAMSLNLESQMGTLEPLWLTTVRRETFVLGTFVSSMVVSGFGALVVLGLGVVAFGARFGLAVGLALPALLLGIVGMAGIAYLVAAAILALREANFLIDMTSYIFIVASGVMFPVTVLPLALKALALMLPTTYALDILRGEALHTAPLLPVPLEYGILAVQAVFLLVIGRWVFLRCEAWLTARGTLSQY